MIPSNLNEKIEIVKIDNGDDVFGNYTKKIVVKKLYANLLTLTNSETVKAYNTNANIILSFRVMHNRFTKELPQKTTEYKLSYKNLIYDIIAAVPDKYNNYIDIKCKAVI